jgi:hypothetical protein
MPLFFSLSLDGRGLGEGGYESVVPPPLYPLPPREGKILEGIF